MVEQIGGPISPMRTVWPSRCHMGRIVLRVKARGQTLCARQAQASCLLILRATAFSVCWMEQK
jgi:hypothetical protein